MKRSLDEVLKSLSDEERAEFTMLQKHEFSAYGLNGEHFTLFQEREDLLSILTRIERYVVDTNSGWQGYAALPENRNKAFIIPRTITDEQSNIEAVLFGPAVKPEYKNLFVFGRDIDTQYGPSFVIHRLETYRIILREDSLKEASNPIEERQSDPAFIERQKRLFDGIGIEKKAICLLLDVDDVSQLAMPRDLLGKIEDFKASIDRQVPQCLGHFARAIHVARVCYATTLMQKRKMRNEFSKTDDINVLNDMYSLQNALFFGAGVMTNDKNFRRMAKYASLPLIPKGDSTAEWVIQ